MLISMIGRTGQSLRSKNDPATNVHSAKAEEPCSMQSQSTQELAAFSLPPPPLPRILPPPRFIVVLTCPTTAWTENTCSDLLNLWLLNTWSMRIAMMVYFNISIINGVQNVHGLNLSPFNLGCKLKARHSKATHHLSRERWCQLVGRSVFY